MGEETDWTLTTELRACRDSHLIPGLTTTHPPPKLSSAKPWGSDSFLDLSARHPHPTSHPNPSRNPGKWRLYEGRFAFYSGAQPPPSSGPTVPKGNLFGLRPANIILTCRSWDGALSNSAHSQGVYELVGGLLHLAHSLHWWSLPQSSWPS